MSTPRWRGRPAKYTDSGGQIRISAERQEHEAVLRVEDNGAGLAREAIPTLWRMFTQVGDTRGSIFTVRLPLAGLAP